MHKHTVVALLAAISAVDAYIIQHINPYSHDVPHGKVFLHGKVLVSYPTYFGHVPFGHHPHFVQTRVFLIAHGHHPAGKPSVPGAIPGHHPGNVPVYPPHFPGVPGVIPDSGPGIDIPPPSEPAPDGGPGAPFPPSPECTVCNVGGGRGNGGPTGGPNGNDGPLPTPDEGGRGDEGVMPGGETPRAGVPPAGDDTPKPEEPAPETPKPEEPAPETPKPEEPAPETPATEEPKPEEPAPEEPKPEEEQKPEREEPKPEEEKSSEEDETPTTEQDFSIAEPPPARLLLPKKGATLVR